MSEKSYQVKRLSELARVTVRTLHHYDKIGLLEPSERTAAGYRRYGEDDLLRLQQILICRELGMPLEQIRRMLDDPGFDRRTALEHQLAQLQQQARETEAMIRSVSAALDNMKGGKTMAPKEIFDGFNPEDYEEEVNQRWGETDAYKESARRTRGYEPEDWQQIKALDRALMESLAESMAAGIEAEDDTVLELAEQHRLHIDRWFYPCSHAMHAQLAGLYTADARFKANFDRYGEGLAEYISAAILANTARS